MHTHQESSYIYRSVDIWRLVHEAARKKQRLCWGKLTRYFKQVAIYAQTAQIIMLTFLASYSVVWSSRIQITSLVLNIVIIERHECEGRVRIIAHYEGERDAGEIFTYITNSAHLHEGVGLMVRQFFFSLSNACLFTHPLIQPTTHPSIHYLSTNPPTPPPIHPPIHPSTHPFTHSS